MPLRLLISLSLALLAGLAARAQTADDFFNSGAQSYITNNIPQALVSVENGLKQYPDNVKLKKLYELLKQQSKQQSQNQQSQQNQQKQSQQQRSQNSQKNQKQDQQNSQQNQQQQQNEQNQSGQKNDEQKQQQQKQKADEKQAGENQQNQNEQGQPLKTGQMTPEEAKRLLDAQKGDEQFLQLKPKIPPPNSQRPTEDW